MLCAVIFDFDGVIVDSEPLHFQAFHETVAGEGLVPGWEEYVEWYIGFDDRAALREMFRRAGRPLAEDKLNDLAAAKAQRFLEVLDRRGVTPYPGVLELIHTLNGRVPLALCSGALRQDVVPILEQLQITLAFDVAVTADDVAVGKPDPASYRLAVERLAATFPERHIVARDCLAVEDTATGVQAARAAGLPVLAVTNSFPAAHLGAAHRVAPSLEGFSLKDLDDVVNLAR